MIYNMGRKVKMKGNRPRIKNTSLALEGIHVPEVALQVGNHLRTFGELSLHDQRGWQNWDSLPSLI